MAEKNIENLVENVLNIDENINVEICYALPEKQDKILLKLPQGTTVETALIQSKFLEKYSLDITKIKVGIYSKLTKLNTILRDRDRIEIYRPLIADPKEVRKKRAAEGKNMKKNN